MLDCRKLGQREGCVCVCGKRDGEVSTRFGESLVEMLVGLG